MYHCVKSVQIGSYFWSVFGDLQSPNTGKYGPEITSDLETFYKVYLK